MLGAHRMRAVLYRVRPLGFIVAPDARILVGEPRQVVPKPQGLIECDRVVQLPIDKHVIARRLEVERTGQCSGRQRGIEVWSVVGIDTERVDIERALLFDQGPARTKAIRHVLFGPPHRNEGAAAAQRSVTHNERRVIADGTESGLRDDLDRHSPRAVVLRGKLIAGNPDRSNLRLRGQTAALESVNANDRAGASHVLKLLLQGRGIIR